MLSICSLKFSFESIVMASSISDKIHFNVYLFHYFAMYVFSRIKHQIYRDFFSVSYMQTIQSFFDIVYKIRENVPQIHVTRIRLLPSKSCNFHLLPSKSYIFWILPSKRYNFHILPSKRYNFNILPSKSYNFHILPSKRYNFHILLSKRYNFHILPSKRYNFHILPTIRTRMPLTIFLYTLNAEAT